MKRLHFSTRLTETMRAVKLLFIFLITFIVAGNARDPYITIVAPSAYTAIESQKLNDFVDTAGNISKYIVEIQDFRDYLVGSNLTINIPNSSDSIIFSTLNTVQDIDGGVYWMGISSDGSYFRIGEYTEGALIDMYIKDQGSKYICISISENRYLMVEYEDWVVVENKQQCMNTEEAPDDDDIDDELELTSRSRCDNNNIRVLVLVTPLADAMPFNTQVVARNLINELNTTSGASGLGTNEVRYTLANALVLPGFVEGLTDIFDDVEDLRNNATAQALRNDNLADIVILLTAPVYTGVAGVAFKIKAKEQNAYCLATINATVGGFTGSHEIGHIIGCRHQRLTVCNSNWDSWPVNAHGYKIGDDFRTIMHAVGCDRARLGIWSNRTTTVMGVSNGNFFNNNAGRIRNRAHKVACFRQGTPPQNVIPTRFIDYIEGSNVICKTQFPPDYTVHFDSNQFPNPQFSWEISENGVTGWHVPFGLVNNGASCSLPFPASLPESFFLRITITGSNQYAESDMLHIVVFDDPTGNCELMMRSNNQIEEEAETINSDLSQLTIFPNPSDGHYFISGLTTTCNYDVICINGTIVQSGIIVSTDSEIVKLDLSGLISGIYLIQLNGKTNSKDLFWQHKIVIK